MDRMNPVGRFPFPTRSAARLGVAAAAVAAGLLAASPARAQYRTGADGHLNDANNRMGSGGYNQQSDASNRAALSNGIVTGNSSSLSYFHGGTQEFDPNTIQINNEEGSFSQFQNISAPVNLNQRSNGQSAYTPVYNVQNFATPAAPRTFTTTSNGLSYIPAPTVDPNVANPDTRLQINNSNTVDTGSNLPLPGTLNAAGPVNPVGNQTLYSMSPLYGVREIQQDNLTQDNVFMSRYGAVGRPGVGPRLDSAAILQARNELKPTSLNDQPGELTRQQQELQQQNDTNANNGANGTTNGGPNGSNGGPNGTNGAPNGTSTDNLGAGRSVSAGAAVSGNSLTNAKVTGQTLAAQQVSGSINSTFSSQQQNLLIPANQQSPQIRELQRRFAANHPNATAAESANQNNRIRILLSKQANDAKGGTTSDKAGGPAAGGNKPTGLSAKPDLSSPNKPADKAPAGKPELAPVVRGPAANEPAGPADQPFVITSLASGIRSEHLAAMLRTAEGQMRSGQFGKAVDTYDVAAEAAPNNPFIPLGRGFAELGASYYGKAEADLTRALLTEPALLAGQYDLKGFLGQDRLKFVQKDLADIGSTEKTARPFLLLAYIDHNVGADDTTVTAKHLDEAEARGANKQLIALMREAWNLKR